MWHKSALAIKVNSKSSFSYFLKLFFVCFQVSIFMALIGIKHSLLAVTSHPETPLHHGATVTEMVPNINSAPDFFVPHEIWAQKSQAPK